MFDVDSAGDFLFHIECAIKNHKKSSTKNIERLFFIIMGLNHLIEWIAPDYDHKNDAKTDRDFFYKNIFKLKEFKLIKSICNGTKHCSKKDILTKTTYGANIEDWEGNVCDVHNFCNGPPTDFLVDGDNIDQIIDKVLNFYKEEWFDKPNKNI